MRSIIAIALVFSATFAGANTLLTKETYQVITKERVELAVATSRAYVSTKKTVDQRADLAAHRAI